MDLTETTTATPSTDPTPDAADSDGLDLTQVESGPQVGETEKLLLTDLVYDVESTGHIIDMPVLYARCRRADGSLRQVEIEGFRPYLGIRQTDFVSEIEEIAGDRRVLGAEIDCSPEIWGEVLDFDELDAVTADGIARAISSVTGSEIYHTDDPFTTIHGEPVARIFVRIPKDVAGDRGLRGDLENQGIETFEADIPFVRRFLISSEIYRGLEAPTGEDRVIYENWKGESEGDGVVQEIEPCDAPDTDARLVVYDIEVATEGDGFPEPDRARKPITAISAYDSYDDEYRLWGLISPEWCVFDPDEIYESLRSKPGFPDDRDDNDPEFAGLEIYEDETQLVEDFNQWVLDKEPDIFSGWNSDGFDTPYLIQRSYNVQALSIKQFTEIGNPGVWVNEYNGNRQVDFSLQGICTLDLFDAYKKTQFRELDSYSLDDVAEAELGYGKFDFEGDNLDDAWHNQPVDFFTYNVRDSQATAEIESESGLLDLYENLREVTGALYEACNNNGPMLDTLFLRQAYEEGLILPTNTEPDEDVYHGAKVFETVPGIHKNAVYPDLSSMYPNLFAMLNLGTETIIGTRVDLEESEYTEDDCFRFPTDNRPFAEVPSGKPIDHVDRDEYKGVKSENGSLREIFDPEIEWMYVLKPEIKESFVRSTVDQLIDLKYNYTGKKYSAVKRVTNSVYGVTGDSASGGVGFRLYDRRVAEGITLAGRLVITHTAEEFTHYLNEHYDEDAELIGGDTDSSVTSIPSAPDMKTALEWAQEAVEHVDESYDEFVKETFGFNDEDDHRLAVELESLASKLFFLSGGEEHEYVQGDNGMLISKWSQESVKKRYSQSVVWDDDDGWLDTPNADDYPGDVLEDSEDLSQLKYQETLSFEDFEEGGVLEEMDPMDVVSITGMEYVRSDTAQVTKDAQLEVLTNIHLSETPVDRIESYLQELVGEIEDGNVPIEKLARPKGIGNNLEEYGWKEIEELDDSEITEDVERWGGKYIQRPGPTYRGAKYADAHFDWEELGPGMKPRKVPIAKVRSDEYPEVYDYGDAYPSDSYPESPEIDEPVDCLAVQDPERIPGDFEIDYDTIIEKEVRDKIEPIVETIGENWDDLLTEGTQTGLDAFC